MLKCLAPHARATPRSLFPNHQAKLIAQVQHQPVLLVVAETDKVCAHLADQLHLFAHLVVAHCGGHSRMVGMALRAAQQHPFAIQHEGTVFDKLNLAYAKTLVEMGLPRGTGQCDSAAIEMWKFRRPKLRRCQVEFCNVCKTAPGGNILCRMMNVATPRVGNLNRDRAGEGLVSGVVEPGLN